MSQRDQSVPNLNYRRTLLITDQSSILLYLFEILSQITRRNRVDYIFEVHTDFQLLVIIEGRYSEKCIFDLFFVQAFANPINLKLIGVAPLSLFRSRAEYFINYRLSNLSALCLLFSFTFKLRLSIVDPGADSLSLVIC